MEIAMMAIQPIIGAMSGAAGAASAAGGASSILSTLGTATSILGTIGSGVARRNDAYSRAAETQIAAGQERVDSANRTKRMSAELARILGQNDVVTAGAGIDLSGGTAVTQRNRNSQKTVDEISIERRDSEYRRALLQARARNLKKSGNQALFGSMLQAIGQGTQAYIGAQKRGGPAADPWAGLRG